MNTFGLKFMGCLATARLKLMPPDRNASVSGSGCCINDDLFCPIIFESCTLSCHHCFEASFSPCLTS